MMLVEMTAFDNLNELSARADDLTAFVRQATVEGTAANEVEKGVWRRVRAMGRPASSSRCRATVMWERRLAYPTGGNSSGCRSRTDVRTVRFSAP